MRTHDKRRGSIRQRDASNDDTSSDMRTTLTAQSSQEHVIWKAASLDNWSAVRQVFGLPETAMNTNLGLLGTKLGMTQYFDEHGEVHRVTAIKAGPCVVIGKRTQERDGYTALQIGFGTSKPKRHSKAELKNFEKAGAEPCRTIRELRVPEETCARFEVGQAISLADIFREGHFVDIAGMTKGRGFTGVIKRHGFSGAGTDTHGTHEYRRHGGSIGMNMTPGRTFKGKKMPGRHGHVRVTVPNLRVDRIEIEDGLLLVRGAVPGPTGALVEVRLANRKSKANALVAAA